MATLVSFLAAGVKGAESGSAIFTLRGTASSAIANMWSDFEKTGSPASNTITLDANGAAEVYVDALVDVEIKDSDGSTLRTVTVGTSASTVEVISDSFTGTPYGGGGSGASEPTTLTAVLDALNNSSSALDWQVDVNGSDVNLSAAIASFSGMFVNVQDPTYGATGDGVTDDSAAIAAAINDGEGAIVFFPPGVYNIAGSGFQIDEENITLMGAGPNSSILSFSSGTSTRGFDFTDTTSGSWKRVIGLGMQATQADSMSCIIVRANQSVAIENCDLGDSNIVGEHILRPSGDGKSSIMVSNCVFRLDANGTSSIRNQADEDESYISVKGCQFIVEAGYTSRVIRGCDIYIDSCEFDASAVTSGEYWVIDFESAENALRYIGSVTNSRFVDGGSSGFAFKLINDAGDTGPAAGTKFSEVGNNIIGFSDPATVDVVGNVYDYFAPSGATGSKLELGYRKGRSLFYTITTGTAAATFNAQLCADTIVVTFQNDATFTFTAGTTSLVPGADLTLVAVNDSGNANDVVFVSDEGETLSSVPDGDHAVGFFRTLHISTTSLVMESMATYQD